jgi:flagellar basal-body rod protein FlgB
MDTGIEAVTTAVLQLALDAASLRQQAIAANIANADAQGYAPMRVSFEEQLGEVQRSLAGGGSIEASTLAAVEPRLVSATAAADAPAEPVRLDVEAARLAENGVRYQALVKGLRQHLAILGIAVADGRK